MLMIAGCGVIILGLVAESVVGTEAYARPMSIAAIICFGLMFVLSDIYRQSYQSQ
jgi:hypothetical protein